MTHWHVIERERKGFFKLPQTFVTAEEAFKARNAHVEMVNLRDYGRHVHAYGVGVASCESRECAEAAQ